MKTILSLLFLIAASAALAQESKPVVPALADTSWKHTMVLSANITQISFTDWSQGGENALAYALFLEGKSAYTKDAIEWVNEYKFGYGQAKLGSQTIRKTDDMIDLGSVIIYKTGSIINPYASVSLKTQFTEGVTYDAAGHAVPVSNFFDPAYIIQSAGVGYQPIPEVKTRLGAALREIITKTHTRYSDDPTTTQVEKEKVEGGMESVTEVAWTVMENVVLHAKFELFAPIKHFSQTTIRSDNSLSAKINKFLSVNLNVQLINDPPVQARTQVKQALALGFSYTLM
jgi:opacity protein-like surface antigen